ncbi:corepressor interacting with RBPJ 1-like [Etheostoma cragini]|uniref:corepressor interacting with RBPJ 1-like n=1 Tax=Etheostoma cragini TaxID=417921 RepID=UPI00155F1C30|nr:corepressor interacting with RBPJ 1-like [Etheostoma cragini]
MPRTRVTRRTNKSRSPPGDEPVQLDNEVVEIQQKATAPTMDKFREDFKLLKEENGLLKEENRLLKEERDFLREKACNLVKTGPSTTSKGSHKKTVMDSSDSSTSDSESDSSSERGNRKRKQKKKKKKPHTAFGKRGDSYNKKKKAHN